MPEAQTTSLRLGGIPISAMSFILSLSVAILGGYGGARYAAGQQESINAHYQEEIKELKADNQRIKANSISKEQFDLLLRMVSDMKNDQNEIKRDIRELNNRR